MCADIAKGTVEWEGHRISIEGPEAFVSVELERFRNAVLKGTSAQPVPGDTAPRGGRPMNDADFLASKAPKDHYEKIAVLAVRLKAAGKSEFDDDEMRRAYLRANIKPPKVMSQALVDTKRFRDYIEPCETRGKYRLTSHGEDFVQFDLPRKSGTKG